MAGIRKVRFLGEPIGEFSIDRLYGMAERGEIDHTAEFWSEQAQEWLGLAGIVFDFLPTRLDDMTDAGIMKVEFSGSGHDDDCPECVALQGQVYPIDGAPPLPPPDCACVPWCRCVAIAVE